MALLTSLYNQNWHRVLLSLNFVTLNLCSEVVATVAKMLVVKVATQMKVTFATCDRNSAWKKISSDILKICHSVIEVAFLTFVESHHLVGTKCNVDVYSSLDSSITSHQITMFTDLTFGRLQSALSNNKFVWLLNARLCGLPGVFPFNNEPVALKFEMHSNTVCVFLSESARFGYISKWILCVAITDSLFWIKC